MKKRIGLTAYLLILLVFHSCNGDLFVNDFRFSDSELTLDGNGDAYFLNQCRTWAKPDVQWR